MMKKMKKEKLQKSYYKWIYQNELDEYKKSKHLGNRYSHFPNITGYGFWTIKTG